MKRSSWSKVRKRYDSWSKYYDAADKFPIISRTGKGRRSEAVEVLKPKPGETLLDLGCGTGEMLSIASRLCPEARLIGADFSPGMLERTKDKVPDCDALLADVERMPFKDDSIDKVIASYTFTSVPDPEACAREMLRIMRQGGRASVLDTARPKSIWWRIATGPTRATARLAGYTYMDREILPMLRKYFRVVKVISYSGGFVWCGLLEKR